MVLIKIKTNFHNFSWMYAIIFCQQISFFKVNVKCSNNVRDILTILIVFVHYHMRHYLLCYLVGIKTKNSKYVNQWGTVECLGWSLCVHLWSTSLLF